MTFTEFAKKLFKYCGNGKNPAKFLRDFFENVVDECDEKITNKDETECRKYLNGTRQIPKKVISYLSSHFENDKFVDFILNNTNDDSLVQLCNEFENEIGIATKQNVAIKLCSLFRNILSGNQAKNQQVRLHTDNTVETEKAIAEIIKKIATIPEEEYNKLLEYEPYNVDKKIESKNINLKHDVRNYVIKYYSFIEGLFKEISKQDTTFFDRFAKEIKYKSDNLIDEGNQQEVTFNKLVDWLKNKATTNHDIACRIIIAFFIQNCEVFHEITK